MNSFSLHTVHTTRMLPSAGADSENIFMVNKPLGWTSFDVIKKLRSALKIKKMGHAGTLDPLATGLLLLCINSATKNIDTLQALPKVYTGQIVLGKTTPSMDLETPFDSECNCDHINRTMVESAVAAFVGTITQTPPIYSALKVKGRRAYEMARKGIAITLAPRLITIDSFVITAFDLPYISFELSCSKGTYVRKIADDLGKRLGVGGYLHALCRTRIGPYELDNAFTIEELIAHCL